MKILIPTENRSERGILDIFTDKLEKAGHEVFYEHPLYVHDTGVSMSFFDFVFLFGDRRDMMSAAIKLENYNIPVIHHHGGDHTDTAHPDETYRRAISRLAHIHFTATEAAKHRLIDYGEEPWRVHNVGSLAIDGCVDIVPGEPKRTYLVLINPMPGEKYWMGDAHIDIAGFDLLSKIYGEGEWIFIEPNGDEGSEEIKNEIRKEHGKTIEFQQLPRPEFLKLLANEGTVLIGNSSAFVIEATYWERDIPTIHRIGYRNTNRYDGDYGDGTATEKMLERLPKLLKDKRLMNKRYTK